MLQLKRSIGQFGRSLAPEARGCRFKSCYSDNVESFETVNLRMVTLSKDVATSTEALTTHVFRGYKSGLDDRRMMLGNMRL